MTGTGTDCSVGDAHSYEERVFPSPVALPSTLHKDPGNPVRVVY